MSSEVKIWRRKEVLSLVFVLVVLAILIIDIYSAYQGKISELSACESERSKLKSEIETVKTEMELSCTTEKNKLKSQIDELERRIRDLEAPDIHFEIAECRGDYDSWGRAYTSFTVLVFNAGTEDAKNVVLNLNLIGTNGNVIGSQTETIPLVPGRSFVKVHEDMYHYGEVAYCQVKR